ncbi:MAG: excinuclease subunit [Bacteroidales bacterium]|jgi:excinuclease ABC subunit C|nr:excinuclease subunit [Bacteroidales bacterium]
MLEGHPFEEKIRTLLKTIPDSPGVYQFFDEKGEIIYIGKARNLKKRVSSYFNKDSGVSAKVWVMARKVADIRVIVVKTEMDALLLENNLIKEHQPRYNINLKDDKTYPWLCIKNEPFPRIFTTRNPIKDGSKYYGPYASGRVLKNLLDLIRQLYPRRTCNLNLTQKNIASGRFKPCLEYHIGNCKAPCIGLQSEEEYNANIAAIREIIRGNLGNIMQSLRREMMEHADRLEFEEAQKIKEKLELLQAYQSKSPVVSNTSIQADVFSIVSDEKEAYVNFLKVSDGAVVQSHTLQIRKKLGEADEELLSYGILEFRLRFESESPEIIVPFDPGIELEGVTLTVPQKGDKKQLLELSQSNAEYFRQEKQRQAELVDPERHTRRLLKQVMKDLRMPVLPEHIECFDNSNLQGTNPVAAMVVFRNGKPSKSEYRHFNIKNVEGPNDFASMEEIVYRRYRRMLEEGKDLPQLIVIDGGKGQLSSALVSLEKLGLRGKITIIGIAKKLEEIYFPEDSLPLYLDKKSETLRLIQHIRDEAHRFGITHHRKKRQKNLIKTELTEIPGIGKNTAEKLLKEFGSVKKLKEASSEDIEKVIGKSKGRLIIEWIQANQS